MAEKKTTEEKYELVTHDGREYVTSDKAEAEHLNRTRGYKFKPANKSATPPANK